MEPAIDVELKLPFTSLLRYDFRNNKLEFDDDESIDAGDDRKNGAAADKYDDDDSDDGEIDDDDFVVPAAAIVCDFCSSICWLFVIDTTVISLFLLPSMLLRWQRSVSMIVKLFRFNWTFSVLSWARPLILSSGTQFIKRSNFGAVVAIDKQRSITKHQCSVSQQRDIRTVSKAVFESLNSSNSFFLSYQQWVNFFR